MKSERDDGPHHEAMNVPVSTFLVRHTLRESVEGRQVDLPNNLAALLVRVEVEGAHELQSLDRGHGGSSDEVGRG